MKPKEKIKEIEKEIEELEDNWVPINMSSWLKCEKLKAQLSVYKEWEKSDAEKDKEINNLKEFKLFAELPEEINCPECDTKAILMNGYYYCNEHKDKSQRMPVGYILNKYQEKEGEWKNKVEDELRFLKIISCKDNCPNCQDLINKRIEELKQKLKGEKLK